MYPYLGNDNYGNASVQNSAYSVPEQVSPYGEALPVFANNTPGTITPQSYELLTRGNQSLARKTSKKAQPAGSILEKTFICSMLITLVRVYV